MHPAVYIFNNVHVHYYILLLLLSLYAFMDKDFFIFIDSYSSTRVDIILYKIGSI